MSRPYRTEAQRLAARRRTWRRSTAKRRTAYKRLIFMLGVPDAGKGWTGHHKTLRVLPVVQRVERRLAESSPRHRLVLLWWLVRHPLDEIREMGAALEMYFDSDRRAA